MKTPARILALALLTSSFMVVALPAAEAAPCASYLPLWDGAFCLYNYGVSAAANGARYAECDVIGGPACGLVSPTVDCLHWDGSSPLLPCIRT